MWYCVDSIEDGVAVLMNEAGEQVAVREETLAPGIREGDWGQYENGLFAKDEQETVRRREITAAKLARLLARGKNPR